jgi:hypothetical protein
MRKILLKSALSLLTMVICVVSFGQTPTINSFSPGSGPVGTLVTISGSNLSSPTNFTIGGVAAIVVSNDGTKLVGMVMPGTTTGTISLSTSGGSVTSGNSFNVTATAFSGVQQGDKLLASDNIGNNTQQGISVAISADGNTAIVGGRNDNSGTGAAWIYSRKNGVWAQQGNKLVGISATPHNFQLGSSVAISADGNTAVIGGLGGDQGSAAISFVFTRIGNVWTQEGEKLIGNDNNGASFSNQANASFLSLSADGNTLIMGGGGDNNNTGAIWVFTRNNGVWSQQGNKLTPTGASQGTKLGISVAISSDGSTIIGAGSQDNSGLGGVWIFSKVGNNWLQQGDNLIAT